MDSYLSFVKNFENALEAGRLLPLGKCKKTPARKPDDDADKVMVFSPHPDDECIIGILPLRLMHEAKMQIVNVAVTLGSKEERRKPRFEELKKACAFLNWKLELCGEDGFAGVSADTEEDNSALWNAYLREIAKLIKKHKPAVIFAPHKKDGNETHRGVAKLVREAVKTLPGFSCVFINTEFWAPMAKPNLLVESNAEYLAELVSALSFHVGELERNPYHVNLPCWMSDNVRRGAELIGGKGAPAPAFNFGTVYKVKSVKNGEIADLESAKQKKFISLKDDLTEIVQSWKS